MDKNITLRKREADTIGVSVTAHGISICAELYGETNGILLYKQGEETPMRIDFTDDMRIGNLYCCALLGISSEEYRYLFHEDGKPVPDIYAKRFSGHRLFGEEHFKAGKADSLGTCVFVPNNFDWQSDKKPKTAYEGSIYYGLHVRGFTKDASSRIKEAGTFAGVGKKIPYLKKLGVTGIVMQPVYEFEECMKKPEARNTSEFSMQDLGAKGDASEMRLNYWGYLPGYYMAPKNAYAYGDDAVSELKTLVRQLHKNGLEIILQFYFEPSMPAYRIRNILLYWAQAYHIDGFELMGAALPMQEILRDPAFADIKLWSESFPSEEAWEKLDRSGAYARNKRLLASSDRTYQNTIRCFLKGDGGMLPAFLQCQRSQPKERGQINYLATYNTLRLADLVSYDRKHNEANGEDNRDGDDNNYSWNCGIEGESGKKHILALRMKQMKNALTMLFTAQGTPFLFMGDEWGKSSDGNNNPYCQDNETTWQKWNLKKSQKHLLAFVSELIAFRKAHGVLHQRKPLQLMDYLSCGFPDLSYHGTEAWRTNMDYAVRHIGVLLCGAYCVMDGEKDDDLYIVYNMHWEDHEFALPKLPKNKSWLLLLKTDEEKIVSLLAGNDENAGKIAKNDNITQTVTVPGRSIRIYFATGEVVANLKLALPRRRTKE